MSLPLLCIHWPLATGHCSFASCLTSGVRSCADSFPLATAIHRHPNWERPNGTRSRRAVPLCQYVTEIRYVTEPGNFFGQIHPFLPARHRPTVDHSLVAGGARRQRAEAPSHFPAPGKREWPLSPSGARSLTCPEYFARLLISSVRPDSAPKVPPTFWHHGNMGGFFRPMADAPVAMNRDPNPLVP